MTTSSYYLSPEIYLCVTEDHVIALDLRRDKYLALDESASIALLPYVRRLSAREGLFRADVDPHVHAILSRLEATGLLSTRPASHLVCNPGRPLKHPQRSITLTPPFRQQIVARDAARCLASVVSAKSALHMRRLHQIVLTERRAKQAQIHFSSAFDPVRVATLCSVYSRLSVIAASPGRCLFDSLALKRFLAKYHLFADWIFGVRLDPFAAHCWLQYDDTLLNESLDTVRRFTPIMAV